MEKGLKSGGGSIRIQMAADRAIRWWITLMEIPDKYSVPIKD